MKIIMKNIVICVAAIITIFSLQTQNAKAAWGDYDSSFGFLGAHIESMTNYYPSAVAVQTDGKILLTGYKMVSGKQRFFLRRYLPSGQPDTAFGSNGSAVSNALININSNYVGKSIAFQANGKIAVAGIANAYPAIWRFNADGSSDSMIGYGGMRTLSNYQTISNVPIAVQNNKLIIGVKKAGNSNFVVVRLNNNGTLDTTFGAAGEAQTGIGGERSSIIVESETDKITISGVRQLPRFGLERLMPDGQSDTNFVFADANARFYPPSFFIRLSNQKYVLTNGTYGAQQALPSPYDIYEFNSNGALESSQNYYNDYNPPNLNCPLVLDQQQDGKVIASAWDKLYRFDSELNVSTAEITSCSKFSQLRDKTYGVLQADDKMVVAGRSDSGGNLTLIRTLPN